MNKGIIFKKSASLFTAIACTGAMISSSGIATFADDFEAELADFAASPTATYDSCDVNHDGSVDITDVITLNKYLIGATSSVGYNQLDANQNHIVDSEDSQCVLAKIVDNSYRIRFYSRENNKELSLNVTSSPSTFDYSIGGNKEGDDNNTNGIKYYRYSYTDGELILNNGKDLTYTLNPSTSPINAQSQNTTFSIDGVDTRYQANGLSENTGIVRIGTGAGSNGDPIGGTGFIVGDHIIATAACCLYDSSVSDSTITKELIEGNFYTKSQLPIELYDSNGNLTGKKLTPVEAHIPEKYTSTNGMVYNYALITVSENLSNYYHFDLGTAYNLMDMQLSNIPIYVTGCPQKTGVSGLSGTTNASHSLYTGEGQISTKSNAQLLYYTTDTSFGQEGSPVYVVTHTNTGGTVTEKATVLAIGGNSQDTGNSGTLITKYQLQFYYNNKNASYTTSTTGEVTE